MDWASDRADEGDDIPWEGVPCERGACRPGPSLRRNRLDFVIALLLGSVLAMSFVLWRTLHGLAGSMAQSSAHSTGLVEAAAAMRERLAELHAWVRARDQMDRSTFESIRRLETVIAGTQSKGAAAENIVEAVFGKRGRIGRCGTSAWATRSWSSACASPTA